MKPLISVKNLVKTFTAGGSMFGSKGIVHAVNDISFDIMPGETFSVVGESGCGKSTTGRLMNHLISADSGQILFEGNDITKLTNKEMRPLRREMQVIFQDPNSSLNPRMRIEDIVAEPLLIHTKMTPKERIKQAHALLEVVGLSPEYARRWPHEFSGGQRQRVGIARALTVRPKLIIADEPVSALDVSIQAQVLNLLQNLQDEFDLTYMFISHDLSVVEMISDRIAVMYLGHIVETGTKEQLYGNPTHPYTQILLSAVPIPDPSRERGEVIIKGDVPSNINMPVGCPFQSRCPFVEDRCSMSAIPLQDVGDGHLVACVLTQGM